MNKLVTLVGPANRFVYIQKVVLPKLVNALYFCCLQCRHRTIPGAAPYSPALTKLIRVPQLRLGRFGELRRKPYNSKARLRAFCSGLLKKRNLTQDYRTYLPLRRGASPSRTSLNRPLTFGWPQAAWNSYNPVLSRPVLFFEWCCQVNEKAATPRIGRSFELVQRPY